MSNWKDYRKQVSVEDAPVATELVREWLEKKGERRVFQIRHRGPFAVLHRYTDPPRANGSHYDVARRIPKVVWGWPDGLR